jgi:hypothetical protein
MEWLALMRHYGAPCRLLDWTHTFWAAVFFAIEKATDFCSVWVVDLRYIWSQFKFNENILSRFVDDEEAHSDRT